MSNETTNPAGSPKVELRQSPHKADESNAFDKFKDLTRRLVSVPKQEIDKERERKP
jgi:hypothetical protein